MTFGSIDNDSTRITLHMNDEKKDVIEKLGEATGGLDRMVDGDLSLPQLTNSIADVNNSLSLKVF